MTERRHGGVSYLHRSGSVHAPLWAAECLGCGHTTRHHQLISVVMAALDLHCTMQNLQVDEARATQGRAVNAERRAAYHQLRDNGQSTYKAAIVLGIKRDTGLRWDKERRDTFDNNRQEASA